MKKILLIYDEGAKREYHEFLEQLMKHEIWDNYIFGHLELKNAEYNAAERVKIATCDADILMSLDMAGFQYKTLLDNYLYNIKSVRQMHLILNKEVWETYRTSEFAINLFVYVPFEGNEAIEGEEESPNRRFYPEFFLKTADSMIDCIMKDFIQIARI